MYCPNCGGSLASEVLYHEGEEDERLIAPEGGILVCTNCFTAVDPNASEEAPAQAPEPSAEGSVTDEAFSPEDDE